MSAAPHSRQMERDTKRPCRLMRELRGLMGTRKGWSVFEAPCDPAWTLRRLKRFNYAELYDEPGQEGLCADHMIALESSAPAMRRRIFSSNVWSGVNGDGLVPLVTEQTGSRTSESEPRRDRSPRWRPHGCARTSATSAM